MTCPCRRINTSYRRNRCGSYNSPNATERQVRYRTTASAGGFVRSNLGQKKSNGPGLPLNVTANQRFTDVSIAVSPTGVLSRGITGTDGESIVLADVLR